MSDVLSNYFIENVIDDSSSTLVWTAHKCVVREEFISLMARRTKLRKARVTELSNRVKTLERAHKRTLATQTHAELLKAREELLGELQKTLKRRYALTNKLFYEFGNKSGKLLAAALQKKRSSHTIHNITFRWVPRSRHPKTCVTSPTSIICPHSRRHLRSQIGTHLYMNF